MCGKSRTGSLTNPPAWLQECEYKGTTEHYKQTIVQKYIMANSYFEDAYLPMTVQLLQMTMKRAWTGKYGNINQPSLVHATDGLYPFTVLDLNEYEAAWLNDEQELINSASVVSVSDLRVQHNKLKICIPT